MTEPITDPSAERAARGLYEGVAHGGPIDGHEVTSRFPKGVVAVDTQAGQAWVYDRAENGEFQVRDAAGEPFDEERGWAAADGADYDLVAVA